MEFRNRDPGAVQYGNFINYYQFNSAEERLKLLPRDHWLPTEHVEVNNDRDENCRSYLILDVGCNSGVFTQLLHHYLTDLMPQRHIITHGIDIDAGLIQRAVAENDNESVSFDCCDVMDNKAFEKVTQYLQKHNRSHFDVICCFSITMWIHLNHHDQGLQEFLSKLSSLAQMFVVEPQPWKCYQTAERRLKKSGEEFPLFLHLQWRSNVEEEIQKYLEETMQRHKVYESCPTKWKRKICFYR